MRPFERVHTMTDYHDGPRRGVADYDGRPHLYESIFEGHADGGRGRWLEVRWTTR